MEQYYFLKLLGLEPTYYEDRPSSFEDEQGNSRELVQVDENTFKVKIETPFAYLTVEYEKIGNCFVFQDLY